MEFALVVVVVLLLLVVLWQLFRSGEASENARDHEIFYENAITVINALQTGQSEGVETALARIMEADSEKKEVYVIFGNVLREKGFISEAIKVHKSVLHRPNLPNTFKGWALACLAEDFRMAGMVDRAVRTYHDAFNLNPSDQNALRHYAHLCKQVGDYEKLLSLMEIMSGQGMLDKGQYALEVGFVYNELGEQALQDGKVSEARSFFERALKICGRVFPAYLNLARLAMDQDNNRKKAEQHLLNLFRQVPDRAFLGLPLYEKISPDGFEDMCRSLIAKNEEDWRIRMHLAGFLGRKDRADEAFEMYLEAVRIAPHVLLIHQEIWKFLLRNPERKDFLREYARASDQAMVFNAPFSCVVCRYKSSEFLWKCPSCYGWNSFVEAKI